MFALRDFCQDEYIYNMLLQLIGTAVTLTQYKCREKYSKLNR